MNRYSPNDQSPILPQFYYNDQLEAKYIREAGKKLWQLYAGEIYRLSIDQFILTADEQGIAAYEELFGILPDLATEDIAFRRIRLLNRNQTKSPFTLEYLQERLDDLLGENRYQLSMDYPNYTLSMELGLDDFKLYKEITLTIESIKPANIDSHLTWIRQLQTLMIRMGAATQTGTELLIYPVFNDELTARSKVPISFYCATGAYISVYPKRSEMNG